MKPLLVLLLAAAPVLRAADYAMGAGDWDATKAFFDKLNAYPVTYDMIGQSYYRWWHGSITVFDKFTRH